MARDDSPKSKASQIAPDLIGVLRDPRSLPRLAAIGAMVLVIVGSFAYVAGLLSPGLLTPRKFVDGFGEVSGIHAGFRRNHAKGMCISGDFESNGQGTRLSKATVFEPGRVSVTGRFSLGGGHPDAADGPAVVRGLGLRFQPAHGQEWRTAMINLPAFIVKTPRAFYEQLLASKADPATGKRDAEKMKVFLAAHPETVRAFAVIKEKPPSSGFADSTFSGLNAFRFISANGTSTPVRWSLVPVDVFTPAGPTPSDKNYSL